MNMFKVVKIEKTHDFTRFAVVVFYSGGPKVGCTI